MVKIFTAALSLMLLASVISDQRLSWFNEIDDDNINEISNARNDNTVYRLPQNVIPLKYHIYIDLFFNERTDRPFSYDGQEYILIQVCT